MSNDVKVVFQSLKVVQSDVKVKDDIASPINSYIVLILEKLKVMVEEVNGSGWVLILWFEFFKPSNVN